MDLRQFIARLEEHGRLRRVNSETACKHELGAVARAHSGPILFENIHGYPGASVFTNGLSDIQCVAIALNIAADSRPLTILREIEHRASGSIKPTCVSSGEWAQNTLRGDAVELFELPVPQWHPSDGGPYLGTWHINVTSDPETGERNVGVYRMQLLGPRTATVSTAPKSHLAIQMAKAERLGRPLEMAVAIGVPESVVMAASAAFPYGCDEYELAGALEGDSMRIAPCQTTALHVPADAEIVIEGTIKPGVRVSDGPYFDYAGTVNRNPNAFLFEATALSFRNHPIFRGTSVGRPGAEDHQLFAVLAAADLLDFHGRPSKQAVQNLLVQHRLFKSFQFVGRLGTHFKKHN
jgi:UbiD family decarboxylase